jgi:hypothetical protein
MSKESPKLVRDLWVSFDWKSCHSSTSAGPTSGTCSSLLFCLLQFGTNRGNHCNLLWPGPCTRCHRDFPSPSPTILAQEHNSQVVQCVYHFVGLLLVFRNCSLSHCLEHGSIGHSLWGQNATIESIFPMLGNPWSLHLPSRHIQCLGRGVCYVSCPSSSHSPLQHLPGQHHQHFSFDSPPKGLQPTHWIFSGQATSPSTNLWTLYSSNAALRHHRS